MNSRRFLNRSLGAHACLGAGGLVWRTLAQDGGDAALSRGMITPATQDAIDEGLRYLAGAQAGNGAWGTGAHAGNTGITGLGGLAFMAGGSQPGRGPYGRNVTNALEYVLNNEDRGIPGFLSRAGGGHGPMYGHGFATLFLAEAHGMISQAGMRQRVRETLGRAVNLIIDSQNREGGWRYQPRAADADLSVTICQIMALRAAKNAGVFVPKSTAERCITYVKECQDRFSGGFKYQRGHGPVGFARTAAGVVALNSAGLYLEDEAVQKGLDYMMKHRPGEGRPGGGGFFGEAEFHYYYGQYYAAQAMWIAGGRYWREWYPAIRNELLGRRQGDGSWNDGRTCRHYCTAMALIILQIPNNYLPIMHR
jgi:hypothetical protein